MEASALERHILFFPDSILSIQEGLRQLNMETEPDEEEEEEEEIDPDVDLGVEESPDVKKTLTPVTWYEGILSCFRPFFGSQGKLRKTTEPGNIDLFSARTR